MTGCSSDGKHAFTVNVDAQVAHLVVAQALVRVEIIRFSIRATSHDGTTSGRAMLESSYTVLV